MRTTDESDTFGPKRVAACLKKESSTYHAQLSQTQQSRRVEA